MPAKKHRYLILFLILLFTFSLITGIWSARTSLAEFIITSALQSSGLEKVSVNIHQLDQNQSQLPHFGFSLLTATGLLKLDAFDASLNYNLHQLADGRAKSIIINKLELSYHSNAKIQTDTDAEPVKIHSTLEPLKIIAELRLALGKYLLVDSLFIQNITLNGEAFTALQGKIFQLKSTTNNQSLDTEISLLDQSSIIRSVAVRISADQLTAELRQTTADAPPAKIELNIHDTFLTGNYFIKPLPLQNWLQAFASSSFTEIDGLNKTENVNGTLSFNFQSDTQLITTLTANSKKLRYKTYTADNAVIKLKINNSKIDPLQHIQVQNGSYIKAGNISYQGILLDTSRIYLVGELTNTFNSWSYKGGFSSSLLTANFQSRKFQVKNIAARIVASAEKLNVSGNFSPAEIPGNFEFALDHNLSRGFGKLSIKPLKPLDLNGENNKLSLLFSPWPYPFDLLSGEIKLSTDVTWAEKDAFSLSATINVSNAGGNVGELLFSGLSFDHELQIMPKLHTISSGKITLKHVDMGIIANNISTNLNLETEKTSSLPQVFLQNLHGEIFGGFFTSENVVYDLNSSTNSFLIKATNIDLSEIVKTQQLDGIVATGRIDGIIPVEINKEGVLIQDGAFINDVRNGTIRYNPATGTEQLKQNPITGIALDALKDFRYSHLSAGVNFSPEGRLTINLQLKGTSPELDTNRPVHLNINTEQNLLSLLKSLRYAKGVSEKIDNKVRRLYEKN
ncbi:MAG: YdbH domain-containing protein [Gammaproteobacteria bacterium]